MLPREETPLERIERDIAWLKGLPDIMIRVSRPAAVKHFGPWQDLEEQVKESVLRDLDWRGVEPADQQRIMEREVDYEVIHADVFWAFRRQGEKCD